MTIGDWLREAEMTLEKTGCPDPAIDASWLLEDTLGLSRAALRFSRQEEIAPEHLARLDRMLRRRAMGEPVQYILHRADFMGQQLYVDDRVLIPRPETETLTEAAVACALDAPTPRVLDLCAGSGAIGLSVKALVPNAQVCLSDMSEGAVEIIRKNAKSMGVDVEILQGNLFQPVQNREFDFIVCNPPYIPAGQLSALQREVQWEPVMALDGGPDGLSFYRAIAAEVGRHLSPNGRLYLEVGIGQARTVLDLLRAALAPCESGVIRDMFGVERVVWIRR